MSRCLVDSLQLAGDPLQLHRHVDRRGRGDGRVDVRDVDDVLAGRRSISPRISCLKHPGLLLDLAHQMMARTTSTIAVEPDRTMETWPMCSP